MGILVIGLLIFLGVHSIRIFADPWRSALIARLGERPWKGLYSIASIVGFVLIVWGYGIARREPVVVWAPPAGIQHLTILLVAIAFVLITAAYVPGNRIKRALGHPMAAGVALWAFGHLIANGTANAELLFAAFLVWSVASFLAGRRRDAVAGTTYPAGTVGRDVRVVVGGLVVWAVFGLFLHGWLIGVRPMG
ncbi:NnrU family protein [Trinickia terrae]|uniref:NnrU family protein n=1 Tax=Trinickia terrae TaxID=2571161 RepID=A0A4U1IFZ5_9BURK|nr:NnrU family protein [Trinickia terrae]TKC92475.1 NnrU family protein [Trinickia terrae]